MMDLSACIVSASYAAALSSANCAVSAADDVLKNSRTAFALCRPPGHHAGKDFAGGYCFINNAAVAAHSLSRHGKVALLDIDYHAGNGTQDIFFERADVLTISIHADPDFEYPHFSGFADETGAGSGLGFHKNFPLPAGTNEGQYLDRLEAAVAMIREFGPAALVVSLGVDTFAGDPLGTFELTRSSFEKIGKRIAELSLPTAIIMEGGYANEHLGENVVTVLEAFI